MQISVMRAGFLITDHRPLRLNHPRAGCHGNGTAPVAELECVGRFEILQHVGGLRDFEGAALAEDNAYLSLRGRRRRAGNAGRLYRGAADIECVSCVFCCVLAEINRPGESRTAFERDARRRALRQGADTQCVAAINTHTLADHQLSAPHIRAARVVVSLRALKAHGTGSGFLNAASAGDRARKTVVIRAVKDKRPRPGGIPRIHGRCGGACCGGCVEHQPAAADTRLARIAVLRCQRERAAERLYQITRPADVRPGSLCGGFARFDTDRRSGTERDTVTPIGVKTAKEGGVFGNVKKRPVSERKGYAARGGGQNIFCCQRPVLIHGQVRGIATHHGVAAYRRAAFERDVGRLVGAAADIEFAGGSDVAFKADVSPVKFRDAGMFKAALQRQPVRGERTKTSGAVYTTDTQRLCALIHGNRQLRA